MIRSRIKSFAGPAAWTMGFLCFCGIGLAGSMMLVQMVLPEPPPPGIKSMPAPMTSASKTEKTKPPTNPAPVQMAGPRPYTAPARPEEPAPAEDTDGPIDEAENLATATPFSMPDVPIPKPRPNMAEIVAPKPVEKKPVPRKPVAAPKPAAVEPKPKRETRQTRARDVDPEDDPRNDRRERTRSSGTVINRTVTMRSDPWGEPVATVQRGTPVSVLGCDGWCMIDAAGVTGWVHESFLGRGRR